MENLKCLFNNFPWDIFFFWFLPILLLALLLWWFMNKKINNLENYNADLEDEIKTLKSELKAYLKATNITTGLGTLSNQFVDDLKIVEGIGPKIEELLNKVGIYTFSQLANTSVIQLKEILNKAGSRFQIHDPTTWAAQAAMARDGKWEELKKWQDELYKGKL
ncbi:hypothetical protein [Emticicia sp. 17c]|uniref:hypothetical protein n=1 Tax=Emticicia sp. 17c TaxID=3127704 RepID=UPI00301BF163